jgi:glycosyltransferase involved in cell wall biosynthesis
MKISVVTTCLNSASTIRETIESVVGQEGDFELEYFITDGGSTDGTIDVARSFGDKLTLVDAIGLNQAAGINLGLKLAGGDIVTFLNADDVYQPGALQKVAAAFKANPKKKWLIGRCRIIDEFGKELTPWITRYKNFLLKHYSYRLLLMENFICQPAVFWRREALRRIGYLDAAHHYVMDYDYWLRMGRENSPIVLSEYLAAFRRFPGTKSNSGYYRQFWDDFRVAVRYAGESANQWLLPFKFFLYIKTILTYSVIYR